jgi:hypothetical protein
MKYKNLALLPLFSTIKPILNIFGRPAISNIRYIQTAVISDASKEINEEKKDEQKQYNESENKKSEKKWWKNDNFKTLIFSSLISFSLTSLLLLLYQRYSESEKHRRLSYLYITQQIADSIREEPVDHYEVTGGWILEQAIMDVAGMDMLSQKGEVRGEGAKYKHDVDGKPDIVYVRLIFETIQQYKQFLEYWNYQCPGAIIDFEEDIIQNRAPERVLQKSTNAKETKRIENDIKFKRTTIIFNKDAIVKMVVPHVRENWKIEHQDKQRWLTPLALAISNAPRPVDKTGYKPVFE